MLKSALDTLQVTLSQLENRIENAGGVAEDAVANPPEARSELGGISGTLVAIQGTLTERELAFLRRQEARLAEAVAPSPEGEVAGVGTVALEEGTASEAGMAGSAPAASEAQDSNLAARQKVGFGIIVLAVLAAAAYLAFEIRRRHASTLSSAPPKPVPPEVIST